MRKKLFFVTILIFVMVSLNAIYVEVGSGTETTNYIPAYGWFDYGWSRTIYLQSDLINEMEINTISYNVNNTPNNYEMLNQSFYMKHTTESTIGSTDYIDPATDDTYELVFSGGITWNEQGWHDIILDSSFDYNGTDNLEILVINNDGSYVTGQPVFTATSATPNRAIYKYADGTFPITAGTLSGVYPNTRFHFNVEGAPTYPTLVAPANNSLNNALDTELVWTIGDNTEAIHVYFSENQEDVANLEESAIVVDGDLLTSYSPTLENASVYYWRIVASNTTSEIIASTNIFTFSTTYGIAEAPYNQGFEDVNPPALPLGWVAVNEGSSSSYVETYSGQAYEGDKSLRISNSGDATGTYMAILPQIENMGSRIKFWTKCSSTGAQLMVGYLEDVSDPATFVEIETISTTSDYQEHTVILEIPRTVRYLALKHANVSTYQVVYIDNILIEEIPENEPTPANLLTPVDGAANIALDAQLTWEYGINTVAVNLYLSEDINEVNDLAPAAMVIENQDVTSYTGAFEEWTTYYWRVGSLNSTGYEVLSDVQSFTTVTPDGTIQIGTGSETNTHLPMEPYYGYTISQTIYDQEWLNVDDQRIEEISYFYNGNGAWTEDNIQVYLGHTDLDSFADGDSWISLDNLVLVYEGSFTVPAEEGWVTIPLTHPFNYNNEENLVIAFESNTQGYSSSGDEFYGSTVEGNKSIYKYSDGTNYDFITPETGTTQSLIANVILTMGDIPTTPQLMVTPDEYSWEDTIINTTANTVTFSMRNTGLGALTINSVSLEQEVDFILTDTNTYPLDITSNMVQFTVAFNPQSVGDFETNIIINDATAGDTNIPLSGTGYDAMISEFPHFEDFEGYESGDLPQDWSTIITSSSSYATASVYSTAYEGERGFRFYNSADAEAEMIAITPPINDLASRRIRFMSYSVDAGVGMIIGTATNNSGDINFTARDTIMVTSDWAQYQHGFIGAPEEDNFIAIKFVGSGATYDYLYLDNFFIESIPTGPAIVVTQDTLNFGDVYLNRTGVAMLNVENWGIAPLEIEFSQDGDELTFIPSEVTIEPNSSQNVTVNLEPIVEGEYSGSFEILSNDTNIPSISVATTGFILPPLPDNIAVVGTGTDVNLSMPIEPFYGYTYSQVIYYAGEIGIANQRIEKISWHYNGNSAFGPDDFIIYMGHTTMTEFANGDDWIDISEFMEVYNGTLTTTAEDGYIEFELDIPFVYDNTQNLVVAVEENTPGYHNSSDEFYCTSSPSTRGIVYYSDGTNPDPTAPPTANYLRDAYANIKLEFGEIPDAPDLTVYPTNSLFEMTPVDGSSIEKNITMRSIGLQDVTIANPPTLGGDDADQFTITTDDNTYPLVLPFNEIATIGVSFTPNSEGSKSATIQIVDDAGRVTHEVVISGYAYADDNNDVPEDAATLTLPVDGDTYAIMPIGDIDWYKIPAMGINDTLLCSVEDAGGSDVNPSMWLYGPASDASEIDPAVYLDNGSNIEFVLPQSGDYYLRVAKSNVYPEGVTPPHTRKSEDGESERLTREDTGLYNLYVDANYNYDFNSPLNLEASNQSGYVALTWVEPPYERYLIGYHVYRGGEAITEEMIPIGTNLYHDANVVVGTEYHYHVVGMYSDPEGYSLPSNTATIIYYNIGEPMWGDDFEAHDDFALTLPGWIQYDIDGGNTYTISNVDYANAGEAMSYMVFNPSATTPPIEDMIPQSGEKFITSFASAEGENDDWLISPRFTVGTTSVVSFYAKSYTDEYGLEKFRVKMSLGGSETSNFQYSLHQGVDYLEAPTEWTLYNFNVSELTGTTVRFAIQCVSNDAFIFMVDNFRIDSTDDGVDNENVETIPQVNSLSQNYPNPFNPETSIAFSTNEAGNVSIEIYNIRGQKVKTLLNDYRTAGNHSIVWNGKDDNNRSVASGVYFYKMRNGKFSSTKKMILMK